MALFTLGIDTANNETNNELREHDGALISGADDTYIIGPPEIAFTCLQRHKERVAKSGLELQLTKTKAYIHASHRNQEYHLSRAGIDEGHTIDMNGVKSYGINVYGIPVGSDKYIKAILEKQATRIEKSIDTTKTKMDPEQIIAPELPGRQCCWALTLRCIQHMGNYWTRHIPPHLTAAFCTRIDASVQTMVIASTQLDSTTLSPFTVERMKLPIKCKGMGLRSLYDRRHAEYIGGMIQGIPPLLNRLSPTGLIITGRMNTPQSLDG